MKIINDGRRLFIRDYTTKEGMELKRRGVNLNFDRKYDCIVAEDNVFNRILLGISCDFLFTDLDVKSISLNEYTREYQVKDIEKGILYYKGKKIDLEEFLKGNIKEIENLDENVFENLFDF